MSVCEAEYKVAGGKMIRIRLNVKEGALSSIRITGDFFMHPEEALEKLESSLRGVKVEEAEGLERHIDAFLSENHVTVLGAASRDFAAAILKALRTPA
ncbi:lipoate protein ligase C-terminal domain-containing protein [Candidatus Hecatella orcuttiae]|jgi:lipoate-protein ligase A|uniref:lipoate protein ligase C-terminal domain-containing protein n=1 Tax=Candidatus Hecatella orcuttiae TaxID=1935119 RepID=UPI002867B9AE|nr:lipoate protein ligase C-terminal domain-containing protein [Candidatus Hecatella orcuttiae]